MDDQTAGSAAPIQASGAKQKLLPKSSKWLGAIIVGVVLILAIVFYLFRIRASRAPTAIAVSVCGDLGPGLRRIRADFGTQFDISETVYLVKSGVQDMPPGINYSVFLKDSTARLLVTSNDTWKEVEDAFPVFSEDLHERNIRGVNGRSLGIDRYGSLNTGERWRFVKFFNRDAVAYLPTAPKEAILLDQVISSACLSRDPHREK